jgi:KaiC/GvpD/RAD55 family RecA-like ATPase
MNRLSTGVKGLDKLLGGGIPENQNILISGSAGTGKSTLGIQYLEVGLKKDENCAYVTIEESPEKITVQANEMSMWSKPPVVISGRTIKYDLGNKRPKEPEDLIKLTVDTLAKKKIKRLVLDSLNALLSGDSARDRKLIKLLFEELDRLNITAMLISEMPKESNYLSRDTISEFMADGIIHMQHITSGGGANRTITVEKMRNTKIDDSIHPFEITGKGIKLVERDNLYK